MEVINIRANGVGYGADLSPELSLYEWLHFLILFMIYLYVLLDKK